MTPPREQAEQIVQTWIDVMQIVGVHPKAKGRPLIEAITDALTAAVGEEWERIRQQVQDMNLLVVKPHRPQYEQPPCTRCVNWIAQAIRETPP